MARPMTREEMREQTYARLGQTAGFYTDSQLNQWLADGIDEICLRTEPIIADSTMDITSGTGEYLLPSNLISIKFALFLQASGSWGNLRETEYSTLFENNPTWEDSSVTYPTHYYWRDNVIGLYPLPDTTVSDALRVVYTCRAAEPSSDASTSGIPDFFDRAIVLWAVYRARLKDRDQEGAAASRAEFEEAIGQGQQILDKQRKDHAPRIQSKQLSYRSYYGRRWPRTRLYSS